jgi:tRNA pseudouridine38-40 synthase
VNGRDARAWRLDLEYEGTAFKGWARQPGERTVQEELERALVVLLKEPVRLSVAGRTDAGVHAWAQVASFGTSAAVSPLRLRLGLNALLPADVAVTRVTEAPPGFDARGAASRTYRYRLRVGSVRPVLDRQYVWALRGELDIASLCSAAPVFVGRRDWSALTPSAHLYHSCVRDVRSAEWRRVGGEPDVGEEWAFQITASGFLHNMVRVCVGTMVDVGQGRLSLDDVRSAIEGGRRAAMGRTAPARGLALVAVGY